MPNDTAVKVWGFDLHILKFRWIEEKFIFIRLFTFFFFTCRNMVASWDK